MAAEEEVTCRVRQLRHELRCLSAELGANSVKCRCEGSHCILCLTTADHLCTSPASLLCTSLSNALCQLKRPVWHLKPDWHAEPEQGKGLAEPGVGRDWRHLRVELLWLGRPGPK